MHAIAHELGRVDTPSRYFMSVYRALLTLLCPYTCCSYCLGVVDSLPKSLSLEPLEAPQCGHLRLKTVL